jgi:hypothetical protein
MFGIDWANVAGIMATALLVSIPIVCHNGRRTASQKESEEGVAWSQVRLIYI